ncbi:MAG: phosphate acyltransferase [Motiliproteus sp.]
MHALGNPMPHMAILSGTGEVTRSMQSSVDAAELTKLAKMGALRGAIVDGPLVFDNAASLEAANIKGIISPVAGNADILLVPNLESDNFLFKQMVYFMSRHCGGDYHGRQSADHPHLAGRSGQARQAPRARSASHGDAAYPAVQNHRQRATFFLPLAI